MSVSVSTNSNLTIKGLNPAAGAGISLLANPSLLISNVTTDDYLAETYTVNPLTVTTALDLGEIATGSTVWVQTDQPVTVTLTQNAVDNSFQVDSYMFMNTAFTAIKFANASATNAAHITVVLAGNRIVNPGSPGIF